MNRLPIPCLTVCLIFGGASAYAAETHSGHDHGQAKQAPPTVKERMVEGEVKAVDKSSGKVTLTHGPLVNLGMPGMTMAFPVHRAAWLEQMKIGDHIRFVAEYVDGVITLVHFESMK